METKLVKKPSKALLRKWYNMTDNNHHAEVRVQIAKYFGDSINPQNYRGHLNIGFQGCFEDIREIRYNDKFTFAPILTTSNLLTEFMMERIGEVYGEDVMESVDHCL